MHSHAIVYTTCKIVHEDAIAAGGKSMRNQADSYCRIQVEDGNKCRQAADSDIHSDKC